MSMSFNFPRHAELFKVFVGTACMLLLSLGHAQTSTAQDANRFLEWSYQDGAAFINEVSPHMPLIAASGAALLVPGPYVDPVVLNGIQAQDRGALNDYLRLTNELGGPKVAPAAAGIFAVSLLTDDVRFQDAAFTSLQSIIYSGIAMYALKYTFGRFRPEEGVGARQFDMFSGNTSFPSGHTSTAFALVTPWALYYDTPASYALMALPVGTALARIAKDRHWPTDVLAGATIGYMTARFLTERHKDAFNGGETPRIEISPGLAPGAFGLNVRVNLD